MLSSNPRGDKFATHLPKNFFDPEISKKYNKYIKLQDSYFNDIISIINESIMRVSIPGLEQELISQRTVSGQGGNIEQDITLHKANKPLEEVIETNTITVTFRHLDSFINYFYLMEMFYKKYAKQTTDSRFMLPITLLNVDKIPVFVAVFDQCLFKSIQGLELSFDSTNREFKEFTCDFTFSNFSIVFDMPLGNLKQYNRKG